MLRLYVPVAVTVVLMASLTYWESVYSDRFTGTSVSAEEFKRIFDRVPKEVGPWVGEDNPVAKETLETAGAVSHVSRTYTNQETNEKVDLWLIVGHSRDISRHTPDICYPSQGFAMDGTQMRQPIRPDGASEDANFHTARFKKESALGTGGPLVRVFWAWNPNTEEEKQWVAPDNSRLAFGNNRAIYKMYFTSGMNERDESVTENTAYKFARMMIPVVNEALFAPGAGSPDAGTSGDGATLEDMSAEEAPAADTAPADGDATETAPAETPADEAEAPAA